MTITDVALYASFSVSLMSFMICREVCVNGRDRYGVRNVDRRRKEKKRKKPSRVRKATFSFLSRSPFKPRSTRRASVDSAVETHEAAIRHVPSRRYLLTGTSRPARARVRGARAARKRRLRVGALSREVPYAAREPTDVPTRPPRASASHPPDPPARKHSLSSSFDIFRARASGDGARQGGCGRGRALHADAARRAMTPTSRDVPCKRAWTCGSWLCRCTRRSTPADLPRRPTEGAICGTAWRGRAGTARRTPGARPAAG